MRKKLWICLALFLVIPAFLFTVSCAKQTVKTEEEPVAEEAPVKEEVAVEEEGRFYYREVIQGVKAAELIEGIRVEILEEDLDRMMIKLSHGKR